MHWTLRVVLATLMQSARAVEALLGVTKRRSSTKVVSLVGRCEVAVLLLVAVLPVVVVLQNPELARLVVQAG